MKREIFPLVVVFAVLVPGLLLAQSNPLVGAWKLNTEKSKFSLSPAPQNATMTIGEQGDSTKITSEGTAADGSHFAWSYTDKYDGQDYLVSGTGVPGNADTVSHKRINANTHHTTWKKAGKVVLTARSVISKDGKVRMIISKGTDANGQPAHNVWVYDKQ